MLGIRIVIFALSAQLAFSLPTGGLNIAPYSPFGGMPAYSSSHQIYADGNGVRHRNRRLGDFNYRNELLESSPEQSAAIEKLITEGYHPSESSSAFRKLLEWFGSPPPAEAREEFAAAPASSEEDVSFGAMPPLQSKDTSIETEAESSEAPMPAPSSSPFQAIPSIPAEIEPANSPNPAPAPFDYSVCKQVATDCCEKNYECNKYCPPGQIQGMERAAAFQRCLENPDLTTKERCWCFKPIYYFMGKWERKGDVVYGTKYNDEVEGGQDMLPILIVASG
jgi:hypothetical protein